MFTFGDQEYSVARDFDDEIVAADAALVEMMRWGPLVEQVRLAGHGHEMMRTVSPAGRRRSSMR
jgi:hypothetical protein